MSYKIPVKAYCHPNGMLVVVAVNGTQIPEYQGKTEDMLAKLVRDYPDVDVVNVGWKVP